MAWLQTVENVDDWLHQLTADGTLHSQFSEILLDPAFDKKSADALPEQVETAAQLTANLIPHLLWLYLALPVIPEGQVPQMPTLNDPQRELWHRIRDLLDAVETCMIGIYGAEVKRQTPYLPPPPSAPTTPATPTPSIPLHGRTSPELVSRPMATAKPDLTRVLRCKSIYLRTSLQSANEADPVQHALNNAYDVPLDSTIMAVTPTTLPAVLQGLLQLFEQHLGGDLRNTSSNPKITPESLLIFCFMAETLLSTGLEDTPVPYRPELPFSVLKSTPDYVHRFHDAHMFIWQRLQHAMSPGGHSLHSTARTPTMRMSQRPSVSGSSATPRPMSANQLISASDVSSTRPRSISQARRIHMMSPVRSNLRPVSLLPRYISPFRMSSRIPIGREMGRLILSIVFYILNLREKRVSVVWDSTDVSAKVPPLWEDLTTPVTGADSEASVNINITLDESAKFSPQRSSVVSFKTADAADRVSFRTTPVVETSNDDVSNERSAYQALQTMAHRVLFKLKARARYEMWWELVMAADHACPELNASSP